MSATSSRGIKQREWQQGVETDSLLWKMCSLSEFVWGVCVHVCACACVCEHQCVTMSVLTHCSLNHKSASLLFFHHILLTPFPHHITPIFPLHRPPAFLVYRFSLTCLLPPLTITHCVMLESTELVLLFCSFCFFPQCERKVHCFCF